MRTSYASYRPTYFGASSAYDRGRIHRQLPQRYKKNSWQLPKTRYRNSYARPHSIGMPFSGQQFVMIMAMLIVSVWLIDALLLLNKTALLQLFT